MSDPRPTYDELLELVQQQQGQVEALTAELVHLRGELDEARRAGKRQAAPFRKGPPNSAPAASPGGSTARTPIAARPSRWTRPSKPPCPTHAPTAAGPRGGRPRGVTVQNRSGRRAVRGYYTFAAALLFLAAPAWLFGALPQRHNLRQQDLLTALEPARLQQPPGTLDGSRAWEFLPRRPSEYYGPLSRRLRRGPSG